MNRSRVHGSARSRVTMLAAAPAFAPHVAGYETPPMVAK